MPETELLTADAKIASGWKSIRRRLDQGGSPTQLFEGIQSTFYEVLKKVNSQWKKAGVNLGQIISAALEGPAELNELVKITKYHPFSQLIQEIISADPGLNREGLLKAFLEAIWDFARSELQIDIRDERVPDEFSKQVQRMLERLLRGCPTTVPREISEYASAASTGFTQPQ